MKVLELGVFGITINFIEGDTGRASITSDMKEIDTPDNKLFNAAVDGLESIILAHFCAGLDISSPEYLEGIETSYLAIGNNMDDDNDDLLEGFILIHKKRNVNTSADEHIVYKVKTSDWKDALQDSENDNLEALTALQHELKTDVYSYDCQAVEIFESFDETVET